MTAIDAFRQDARMREDPLVPNDWPQLTPEWCRDHALRTDCARRQALVEVDVLAAKDELITIYRVQFPVMRQYETYYDANGRNVFAQSQGLPGVGLPREADKGDTSYTLATPDRTKDSIALGWGAVSELREVTIEHQVPPSSTEVTRDTAPFDRPSRENDYREAVGIDRTDEVP